MNFIAIVNLIRSLGPAVFVVADAFRYGMQKHGGETWKSVSVETHLQRAGEEVFAWFANRTNYSLLASASLRILFALAKCATSKKYIPKADQPKIEPLPEEEPTPEPDEDRPNVPKQ